MRVRICDSRAEFESVCDGSKVLCVSSLCSMVLPSLRPLFYPRGIQQGSAISPTYFYIVVVIYINKLLQITKEEKAGSISDLYFRGAANAEISAVGQCSLQTACTEPKELRYKVLHLL